MPHQMVLARLGIYMRTAASNLTTEPMSLAEAAQAMVVNEKYATRTMELLVGHDIAQAVDGGWVRGPMWQAYANRHGWPKTSSRFQLG